MKGDRSLAANRIKEGRWEAQDRIEQGRPVGGTQYRGHGLNTDDYQPAERYAARRGMGRTAQNLDASEQQFRDIDAYQGIGRSGMFTGPNRYYQGFQDPTVDLEDRKRRLNEFLMKQGLGSIPGMQ